MSIPRLYPGASQVITPTKMGVGALVPRGFTVHHTGGGGTEGVYDTLIKSGIGYHLLIERNGKVIQLTNLNLRVNHAGVASWNKLSPNRMHIAVCFVAWGALTLRNGRYYSWADTAVPADQVRKRAADGALYWHKATAAQEAALYTILKWGVSLGIDPANVCGHDECCIPKGRKDDPGGGLSKTMPELRKYIILKNSMEPEL